MVKIGIDYTAAVHQTAGIGRYTRELVKALVAASNAGLMPQYRLFVAGADTALSLQENLGPAAESGLSRPSRYVTWCPSRLTERWLARLWYRLHLPLPIEFWTGQINLFHAPDFFLPPVKSNTRTVVTIHDLSFIREPESTMPGMARHLNTWVPRSVERADHVVAVSEATKQDLIDLYQTSPEKITVLYHGVTPNFRPIHDQNSLNAVRKKYGLGEHPFILSVGTIQPRKNYELLIRVLAKVEAPVSLVIAGGKGWHYETIFDEVARQGLQDRVYFPGFIKDEDLPSLYSAATLFAYPSLYEGFGLPLLEAMACGTPAIASNRSALPEVVGAAGLLVDPQDEEALTRAISELLEDKALHRQLSQAGVMQAKKFSWPKMAERLLSLYQKVIN